jgi:hypothetical protein
MCIQSQFPPVWLPASLAFLSGLPEAKRRRRPLVILQAYVDESGTRNQDACLVLAGFISPAEEWAAFSDEWQACLDSSPSLRYFKMREAANNPSGAFKNWKRDAVEKKVHDLVDIIKRHAKVAIHCTTPIQAFDEILGKNLGGSFTNPYIHNFSAVMTGIGWEAIDQKADKLDLIFDEQDKYSPLIKNIYHLLKDRFDPKLSKILPVEPMFKSDMDFLPIQAADMLAWLFRNASNGKRTVWEWVAAELMPVIPMSEYSSIYTADRLQNVNRLSQEISFAPEELAEMRRVWQLLKK